MLSVAIAYFINWNGHGLEPALGLPDRLRLLPAARRRCSRFVGVKKVKQVGPPERAIGQGSRSRAPSRARADPADSGPPGRSAGAVAGRDLVRLLMPTRGAARDLVGGERVAGVLVGHRRGEDHAQRRRRPTRRSGRRSCRAAPGRAARRPRGSPCRRRRCSASAAAARRGSGRAGRRTARPGGSPGSPPPSPEPRVLVEAEGRQRAARRRPAPRRRGRGCSRRPRPRTAAPPVSTTRGRDPGHHVGVGHQPVRRRRGSRVPSTPRPQALVPRTLSTLARRGLDVGVVEQPLGPRADLDDPLGRERLEVAREEARADDVVEGLQHAAGRLRQHLVDLRQHRRAAHQRGDRADPGAGDRDAERPGDEQHGERRSAPRRRPRRWRGPAAR